MTNQSTKNYSVDSFGYRRDEFTKLWIDIRTKHQLSRKKSRKIAWHLFLSGAWSLIVPKSPDDVEGGLE